MLTSLLPGLRQIRAPLSAGFVWLLGLWLLLDRLVADDAEVRALLERVHDVLGEASVLGVGAAWAFAAYLLGSLGIGTLSPTLSHVLDASWLRSGRRSSPSLLRLSQQTRLELESTLALTDVDLDAFLDQRLGTHTRDRWRSNPKIAPIVMGAGTPGVSEPIDFDELNRLRELAIADSVRNELEDVAVSRLLGAEPELYGEWDRERAEVEFRLALTPALLFLAIAVAVQGSWWWLAVPMSWLASLGLLRDAARSEVRAREIVVVALANDRVQSPVIERLMAAADEAAQYGTRETINAAAVKASSALADALRLLERAGRSEPASAHQAQELVDQAASTFAEGKPLFDAEAVERFELALQELRPVAQAWVDIIEGNGGPNFDMQARVYAASAHHAGFLQAVRSQLSHLAAAAIAADSA